MTNQIQDQVQADFNSTVGVVLTYLDEAGVGTAIKRAVKTEIYSLCDDKVMKIIEDLGKGKEESNGKSYNR